MATVNIEITKEEASAFESLNRSIVGAKVQIADNYLALRQAEVMAMQLQQKLDQLANDKVAMSGVAGVPTGVDAANCKLLVEVKDPAPANNPNLPKHANRKRGK